MVEHSHDNKEDSVRRALKELMEGEEERLLEAERERKRREEGERRRREESEREQREREAVRIAAEKAVLEEAERLKREEAERRRLVELEADRQLELEKQELAYVHARELKRFEAAGRKVPAWIWGAFGTGLVLFLGLFVFAYLQYREAERGRVRAEQRVLSLEDESTRLSQMRERESAVADSRIRELEGELRSQKEAATAERSGADSGGVEKERRRRRSRVRSGKVRGSRGKKEPSELSDDPLGGLDI